MTIETINIPDVGGDQVEVIEVSVAVGDHVDVDATLVILESDKASMEIPCPKAGVVTEIKLSEGDKVGEGDAIICLELDGASAGASEVEPPAVDVAATPEPEAEPVAQQPTPEPVTPPASTSSDIEVAVPDIGGEAEVIEISVAVGDVVAVDDSLCLLESDKASMEVPSPQAGTVTALKIKLGDKVSEGTPMLVLTVVSSAAVDKTPAPVQPAETATTATTPKADAPTAAPTTSAPVSKPVSDAANADVYAGPVVRKLARELGVDLAKVVSSGPRGRIVKQDLYDFVKTTVNAEPVSTGSGIPQVPEIDFSEFGSVRIEKLTKIEKLTSNNMHRSWLNVPHVTQFDDIDITELEAFRKALKAEAEVAGVRLTPLPFLLKAVAAALKRHPKLNASLHADGEHLVYKDYIHIGVAVDTAAGLVVPVVRDVDKKGLYALAQESAVLAAAAKDRKLKPADMKGGCFTISSLGGLGGKGFTPIVNTPEVAILGVSRLSTQPVWNGSEFLPRQMLPLSLSYDHRVVNGADAGRFFSDLSAYLQDVRRLLV